MLKWLIKKEDIKMWGIIATWCMAYDGINKASEMLKNDDDAGNAIEEAIKVVEDCPNFIYPSPTSCITFILCNI